MKKPVVLHFFLEFPEKNSSYNTRFWNFAKEKLPEFEHTNFAWINRLYIHDSQIDPNYLRRKLKNIKNLIIAYKKASYADIVVFHGLFYGASHLLSFLLWPRYVFRRAVWVVWGGDLYYYKNRPNGIKSQIIEIIRRRFVRRLHHASALVPGDLNLLSQIYRYKGKKHYAFYPNPVSYAKPDYSNLKNKKKVFSKPLVMVGNSADPTNQHETVLRALHRIWDGSFMVYVPLAYGSPAQAKYIKKLSTELFGSDAIVQQEFIEPTKYREILDSVDVAVYYHNRQQALGNILGLLASEKKVYVRADTTTYGFLKEQGIPIHNSFNILEPSFTLEQLFAHETINNQNQRIIELVSDERAKQEWRSMLFSISIGSRKK